MSAIASVCSTTNCFIFFFAVSPITYNIMLKGLRFCRSFIHSFLFTTHCILSRVRMDLEHILGTLGVHTHSYTHSQL